MNGTIPNEKYMRPEEACKLLKITTNTLINWDTKGKIKCARTKGGHRRFLLSDFNNFEDYSSEECYEDVLEKRIEERRLARWIY